MTNGKIGMASVLMALALLMAAMEATAAVRGSSTPHRPAPLAQHGAGATSEALRKVISAPAHHGGPAQTLGSRTRLARPTPNMPAKPAPSPYAKSNTMQVTHVAQAPRAATPTAPLSNRSSPPSLATLGGTATRRTAGNPTVDGKAVHRRF